MSIQWDTVQIKLQDGVLFCLCSDLCGVDKGGQSIRGCPFDCTGRIDTMSAFGIPTEFHAYEGLSHGFGLGTGTVAEGWLNQAVELWEEQIK